MTRTQQHTETKGETMKTAYHPEMDEVARTEALFNAHIGYKKVIIRWTADRDDEARQAFKTARCRPSNITFREAGEWVGLNVDGYTAAITFDAYEKLGNTDMEILLD
jgi:hypothetical protein